MSKLNILVVDDEPGIRSGIHRILQNYTVDYPFMDESIEFIVHDAATGKEAIHYINATPPDIVLLDNKLPDILGIEVLEYIKKRQLNIIVVMITSYASLELAVKATKDGAYDFIPKPFSPQELRASMENIAKQIFLKQMTQKMNKEGKQIRFQFLSILSHELKAPLNAVEGYLQMVKNRDLGDALSDYEDIIDRSLKRISGMRNLIMDLLDLTYIESGSKKRNIQQADMVTIAQSAIDTMKPYAIQRDIEVYLNSHTPILYECDPDEIEMIFNNLISNAIKYNKDKGRVDCIIHDETKNIQIIVSDTGIGISEIEQEKLFNEFVRIKNKDTKNISGSGLGLSILKKITDLYNGTIKVKSNPGKGSTFIVNLPK